MWHLPLGATLLPASLGIESAGPRATEFRLWASRAKRVELEIVERNLERETSVRNIALQLGIDGTFSAKVEDCPAGTLYRYRINGGPGRPDPYSRFQPFGVHGPSQVIDPSVFHWTDLNWRGIAKRDLVIYELHIGSFSREGTYLAAIEKFPKIVELGINAIELLPLAQSPGRWNWGYDGVNFFAPRNSFGTPDELRQLINAAHHHGLAVILDVVYNHVGPEGNYLNEFSHYRSKKFGTPWGDSLNFKRRKVRDFVIDNGIYWLEEFHFDGLRLDAIHYLFDDADLHIVTEFAQRFRQYQTTCQRQLHLIAEANIFDSDLLAGELKIGHYDAIWSDCLMHSLYSHGKPDLRLTNRYYQGTNDVVDALKYAYVFAAPGAVRVNEEIRQRHLTTVDSTYKSSLVMALQTHDSVGNHPHGKRLHHLIDVDFQRAAAPLILLYPSIPMLFMGEEWATSAPFPFFVDFEDPGLRKAVDRGRQDEYPHHDWTGSPLPSDPSAFFSSKLDEAQSCEATWRWYQQLLSLRRKGISDGWLNIAHQRTHHDQQGEIFSLVFELNDYRVTIAARLAQKETTCVRVGVSPDSVIWLNSQAPGAPYSHANREIEFSKNHCWIWKEPTRT